MAVSEPSRRRNKQRPRPATTAEGREQQLIAAAVDLAEQKILDGTAASQVIVHYLKLGSTRETLEQERLRRENELLRAKVESLASSARMEDLYDKAIIAMRVYQGRPHEQDAEDQMLHRA